mgnify:CR=1 FL=1
MKRINVTQTFLPPKEDYFELVSKLWETKWLTNRGQYVLRLEEQLASYLSTKTKPLLVNNGTIAIQLAIKALDLKGEIITTPFSYIATSSSIIWENCQPVFVDIDEDSLNIDANKIEAAITNKTCAIIAVHVFGNPCDVEKINNTALAKNIQVIYDAAHCFGVQYKNESIFNFGDISTCSFHATKLFQTGEGGAVFCNKETFSDKIFQYHNFGHNGTEDFHGLGINAKMNELNAAMGLALLPHMDYAIQERKATCAYYDEYLNLEKIIKQKINQETFYNYAYYPVVFESEEILLNVQKKLNDQNVFPRRYFYPSLNTINYINGDKMPISESISERVLCLPLYVGLEESNVKRISTIINSAL